MKNILVLGSNLYLETVGNPQHIPEEDFGECKKIYIDLYNADITYNLNNIPYPFEDEQFDGVFASHILEHLNPLELINIMKELRRITKKGSRIIVYVPHFSNSASPSHITHYRSFGIGTFNPICDNTNGWEKYIRGKFKLISARIRIPRRFFFCELFSPGYYESYLSRIFPAHEIKYVIETK